MEFWYSGLPSPIALALVIALGYAIGRFTARRKFATDLTARREFKRARAVVRELEIVGQQLTAGLDAHQRNLAAFKQRVQKLSLVSDGDPWRELAEEAEKMLKPTSRLSTQIAHAYDEVRQQTNMLLSFTEVRTDPLTGLRNRRALDESLAARFALSARYGGHFSLAIFDIDHFKQINDDQGHLQGDHVLQQVARTLDDSVRDTDLVARFGGEEFVVVMPETDLKGAAIFADRTRRLIAEQLCVTVSGGVASSNESDSPRRLLARADQALYAAKDGGRNRVYQGHSDGLQEVDLDALIAEGFLASVMEDAAEDAGAPPPAPTLPQLDLTSPPGVSHMTTDS